MTAEQQPTAEDAARHWAALTEEPKALATAYRMPLTEQVGQYRVESRTAAGTFYTVAVGAEGAASCTCQAYERGRQCWHIAYIKGEVMTQALTTIKVQPPQAALPTLAELQTMDMVAAQLIEAKAVAIPQNLKSKEDVRAVLMAGWEIGVKPMTALRHISIINGKTEPDGQLMAGIVLSKEPESAFDIIADTDQITTVRLTRPSKGLKVEYTYSMADAKAAGLDQGPVWKKFPRDMRRWAAIKRLCRTYCSDLINGIASVTMGELPTPVAPEPDLDTIDDYIDVQAVSPPTEDAMYSEGDEEPEAEPEAAPRCSETQRAAILDWSETVKQQRGADALKACQRWAREAFDYAIEGDRFISLNLYAVDASAYIDVLRSAAEAGTLPVAQQGLPV